MMKGRGYAILLDKENCIKYHELAYNTILEIDTVEDVSPLVFPFLQAMITDFKEIGDDKLSQKYNEELVESAKSCFGENNIFYLGYTFDYYCQAMTENFNKGYQ